MNNPVKVEPLTTKEAWDWMGDVWSEVKVCGCGCGRYCPKNLPGVVGLCATLATMLHRKMITPDQERAMLARIPKKGTIHLAEVRPFQWATDRDGAKERSGFCDDEADKLTAGATRE